MLDFMEDQTKIFTHGLKAWAKIKPRKSQTELAEVVGKTQPTISDYFKGEYYPDMDTIQKWVSHYELDFENILQMGREELAKNNPSKPTAEIEERLSKLEKATQNLGLDIAEVDAPTNLITERHRKVIERFQQKALALEINEILVEIEDIDKDTLKDAVPILNLLRIQAEKAAAKKRSTANEKD